MEMFKKKLKKIRRECRIVMLTVFHKLMGISPKEWKDQHWDDNEILHRLK